MRKGKLPCASTLVLRGANSLVRIHHSRKPDMVSFKEKGYRGKSNVSTFNYALLNIHAVLCIIYPQLHKQVKNSLLFFILYQQYVICIVTCGTSVLSSSPLPSLPPHLPAAGKRQVSPCATSSAHSLKLWMKWGNGINVLGIQKGIQKSPELGTTRKFRV